jgi:two-component system heavy metal sensor histidine kinase CusS
MLDRLQQDFRRLSEFSSDLAHELRTPISNLLTETQVTLSQKRTADDYRNTLASNSEELQRLARMVSDMLFLAKTEHGLALPHPEAIALETEVAALDDFYEALAADKCLQLVTEGAAQMEGDRLMVRRALSNLLSNAIRHSPEHGQVCIAIRSTPQGAEVSVSNQGEAIAPDVLPRLFDRFYRADTARRHPQRVVFAEGIHPNMLKAAVEAKAEGICHPILLGNDEAIGKLAEELDLSLEGIEIVNLRHPDESERRERYARILAEKRSREGFTYEEANDKMFERNYYR